jgi:hypothetical protein
MKPATPKEHPRRSVNLLIAAGLQAVTTAACTEQYGYPNTAYNSGYYNSGY